MGGGRLQAGYLGWLPLPASSFPSGYAPDKACIPTDRSFSGLVFESASHRSTTDCCVLPLVMQTHTVRSLQQPGLFIDVYIRPEHPATLSGAGLGDPAWCPRGLFTLLIHGPTVISR